MFPYKDDNPTQTFPFVTIGIIIINILAYLWGHFKFLTFYLVSGIVAAYSHAITAPSSTVPMIGASGAVAGVLGAYIYFYSHVRGCIP